MPISQYRDLFHPPSTLDNLNLLQSLVDSKDLIPALALSFINVIRAELEQPQKQNASAYRRYSEVTGSLCQQMPEVYGQVVNTWQERRNTASVGHPFRSVAQKPVKPASARAHTTEAGEGGEESEGNTDEPAKDGMGALNQAGLPEGLEEGHQESKEEREEAEEKEEEQEDGEGDKKEEEAEETGKEKEEEADKEEAGEKEKDNEENEGKETEEQELKNETETVELEDEEESEEQRETADVEEVESKENEPEVGKETSSQTEEVPAGAVAEVKTEAESESGHMAVEAAEAAAESERMEAEAKGPELPEIDEEEPPFAGVE